MDFSLFNEFDAEILGYEKKNIIKTNKIKTNNINNNLSYNKELSLDIKLPYINVEKIIIKEENNITFKTNSIELDINFLQRINDYKINSWSKKILDIINFSDDKLTNNINLSGFSAKNVANKNKGNIKITPFNNSASEKNMYNNSRKFIKSISFNSIPLTSKFH